MLSQLPFALQLEIRRVDMLYLQNRAAPLVLALASASFAIIGWDQVPRPLMVALIAYVLCLIVGRAILTLQWSRHRSSIAAFTDLDRWLGLLMLGCLLSGLGIGIIGAMLPFYFTVLQQFYFGAMIFAICSGSITAYTPSLACSLGILIPGTVLWAAGVLCAATESRWHLLMVLVMFVVFHMRMAFTRFADFESSLRTSLDLELNKEKLRMAMDSSGAISWEWSPFNNEFICDDSLQKLLLIAASSIHHLDDYAHHIHPDDRKAFLNDFAGLKQRGHIDSEHRILLPDGSIHYVAVRGQGQVDKNNKLVGVAGIFWNITAKKLEELRRFERDLGETADRAKLLFLANVSHEIRTPLTAINGFAETTLRDNGLSPRARDHLRIILRSGKYLTSVVHDLLDLSKAETGNIFIQKTRVSLVQEIVDSLNVVQGSLQQKGLSLNVSYETPIPESIFSDPTRLRQILINLLSNAIKYTDHGSVSLRASFEFVSRASNGRITIVVSDTGMGIPEAQRGRLFQPFTRGEGSDVKRRPGSGLGLALARSLAVRMGGDLRLLSSNGATGSSFELTLDTGPIEGIKFIVDHPSNSRPEVISFEGSRQRLKGTTVLLVEDDEDIRWLLQDFLTREGARVVLATNGQEALNKAFLTNYDAILMDINMPVMDGYVATTLLRQQGFRNAIVALTAHASSNDELLCYQAGCDYYLSKPIDFTHLTEVLTGKPPTRQVAAERPPAHV